MRTGCCTERRPHLHHRARGGEMEIDLLHGQKTGFYLDQRAN